MSVEIKVLSCVKT